jgi:hypothetical protein
MARKPPPLGERGKMAGNRIPASTYARKWVKPYEITPIPKIPNFISCIQADIEPRVKKPDATVTAAFTPETGGPNRPRVIPPDSDGNPRERRGTPGGGYIPPIPKPGQIR